MSKAIRTYFDCKSFTSTNKRKNTLKFTFHGVAENTKMAAMAFEMLFNVTAEWALRRRGKGKGSQSSYWFWVAHEQQRMAKAEKATEEAQAKKAEEMYIAARVNEEKVKRQAELERLMPLPETQDGRVSVPAGDIGGTDGGLIVHLEDARSATSLPSDETDSDTSSDGDPFDDDDNCVEADFTVIEDDEYTGFNRSKHERSKKPDCRTNTFSRHVPQNSFGNTCCCSRRTPCSTITTTGTIRFCWPNDPCEYLIRRCGRTDAKLGLPHAVDNISRNGM